MNAIFGFPATATPSTLMQLRGLALILAALLLTASSHIYRRGRRAVVA
jgi:hypothetical protein